MKVKDRKERKTEGGRKRATGQKEAKKEKMRYRRMGRVNKGKEGIKEVMEKERRR